VWSLAWPTVLTMASYTVMQFVDGLMVSWVGPTEVAAQGNGGIWSFNLVAFALGVITVINTYVAQNLGAGRPQEGPKYAWAGAWLSLGVWLVLLLPWALALPWFFSLLGHGEKLRAQETGYAQILLIGSIFMLLGRSMHHYFFGMHRPKIITLAAIVGNLTNGLFNYLLIFGAFGFPKMGIYGAAWGTVIGTVVELLIPAMIFLGPKMNRELGTRRAWRPHWGPVKDILKIGWPAATQWGNEIVAWSIFMTILVGKFGEAHMTAGWATLRYMHLSFMPAVGFSVAVSSLAGRYIGAGRRDLAARRVHLGLALAMGWMTVCALLFFILREQLIGFFVATQSISAEEAARIIEIGGKLMICAAIFQTFDALGIVYMGGLRGAGDTVWPGVVTIVLSWVLIVGLGWAITEVRPEWESVGPWIGAAVYIIILGLALWYRFESGAWKKIQLVKPAVATSADDLKREAALVAPAMPGLPAPDAESSIRDLAESESEAIEHERECESRS
jgi:MATE family multidrug resistance protein